MTFTWKRIGKAAVLGLGLLGGSAADQANAGLILSYEAAGVQASKVAGVTTETFDSYPPGTYTNINGVMSAVGAFTSPGVAIRSADLYGGAGGMGNYFAIGAQSGTTTASLAFNGAQSYFGFWWSAADRYNSLDLYSSGQKIGTFATSIVLAALGSDYNGNPNGAANPGEKYAYLNITGTNGTTIDRVVFNNANLSTGFEADNFSIRGDPTAVSGTIINGGIAVPEPSSLAMASISGLMGCGAWLRNRRRGVVAA